MNFIIIGLLLREALDSLRVRLNMYLVCLFIYFSQSPMIPILSILAGQTKTVHIFFDSSWDVPSASFPQSPSSYYIARASLQCINKSKPPYSIPTSIPPSGYVVIKLI